MDKKIELRNGMQFIDGRRVNQLDDVDRFFVFQNIADVNEPDNKGVAKTKTTIYFFNNAMELVFCVNANSEFEHGFISIDSEVVTT